MRTLLLIKGADNPFYIVASPLTLEAVAPKHYMLNRIQNSKLGSVFGFTKSITPDEEGNIFIESIENGEANYSLKSYKVVSKSKLELWKTRK